MSKKTLLKSIIAVSAATTMLISTTAFAAVNTSTYYMLGSNNMTVKTTVTELTAGDEVAYLAGTEAAPVYIDQKTVAPGATTVEFTYQTDVAEADLLQKTVKVAKADKDFQNGETLATAGAITDPENAFTFNVVVDTVAGTPVYVKPGINGIGTTVNVPFTLASGKQIAKVELTVSDSTTELEKGTGYTFNDGDTNIQVTHGITPALVDENDKTVFTPDSATITITTEDIPAPVDYNAPTFVKAFKSNQDYTVTFSDGDATGNMFAIYATADAYTTGYEWGIAVWNNIVPSNDAAPTAEWVADTNCKLYKAVGATAGETFGIGIIDTDKTAGSHYWRTYYKDATGAVEFGSDMGRAVFK